MVKDVLAGVLRQKGVEPFPVLIGRARNSRRGGGNVSVQELVDEMVALRQSHDAVTCLVDFYGFRDQEQTTVEGLELRLNREVQSRLQDTRRVIPYVQLYEFECLLFSDVEAFRVIGLSDEVIEHLRTIRRQFETPEDINNSPVTAPSKRIEHAIPHYRKVLHGPMVANEVGLGTIRMACPRFDGWLTKLEEL